MKLKDLLKDIIETDFDLEVTGITSNSKLVKEGYLFLALDGKTNHGINFLDEAIANGCVAALTDNQVIQSSVPLLEISDLKAHIVELAGRIYPDAQKIPIIGITGTNGKTSVGFFINKILNQLEIKSTLIGTLGAEDSEIKINLTTPDLISLYQLLHRYYEKGFQRVVLEISSHALDQKRVEGLNIDTAIFTNITHDHLDYHHTFSHYLESKKKLFRLKSVTNVIINRDDHFEEISEASDSKKIIDYSLSEFEKIQNTENGFLLNFKDYVFELNLIGKFNLSNALAAYKALESFGFNKDQIIPKISQLTAPPGRLQKVKNKNIWIDFAHTPDALESILVSLKEHLLSEKITVVFGCGGDRDKSKRALMGKVAQDHSNRIILTNDNPRNEKPEDIIKQIMSGISHEEKVDQILDRKEAIKFAISTLEENECCVIAGKGHETQQIIGKEVCDFSDYEIASNA